MAYVEERSPRGGSGMVIVGVLVIVVLLLVAWMVFGGQGGAPAADGATDINVEVPEEVNVDVKSSDGGT